MQICKINLFKKIVFCASLFIISGILFAAESNSGSDTLQMPEMPDMPSVTLDGSFYKPSLPTINGTRKPGVKNDNKTKNQQENETTVNSTKTSINSLLNNSDLLSAQDISSLYDYGLFDNISSLTGNLSSFTQNSTTELLLKQILSSLDELKQKNKTISQEEKAEFENVKKDSQTFKTRNPSILRFKINGYDMKDSLTTVFFSEPETDGSFLLTADRTYFANQRNYTETFYVLFKAVKSNGSYTTFEVIPSIIQNTKNENSFVYQMSQLKNLTASKTGNLVVLNYTKGSWALDMLLDIDLK